MRFTYNVFLTDGYTCIAVTPNGVGDRYYVCIKVHCVGLVYVYMYMYVESSYSSFSAIQLPAFFEGHHSYDMYAADMTFENLLGSRSWSVR